jgi:hypothetical protein
MSIKICRAPWSGDITAHVSPLLGSYQLFIRCFDSLSTPAGVASAEEPPCGVNSTRRPGVLPNVLLHA